MAVKKRIQLLVIVPEAKKAIDITGSRSFAVPRSYNAEKLLAELLRTAGLAIEAMDSKKKG